MKVKRDCSEGKFVCCVSPSYPNPILGIHTEDEEQLSFDFTIRSTLTCVCIYTNTYY